MEGNQNAPPPVPEIKNAGAERQFTVEPKWQRGFSLLHRRCGRNIIERFMRGFVDQISRRNDLKLTTFFTEQAV